MDWVAVKGMGLGGPTPRLLKLAIGTWNVTSLVGKVPELVQEFERYWVGKVDLISLQSSDSGTRLEFSQLRGGEQVCVY